MAIGSEQGDCKILDMETFSLVKTFSKVHRSNINWLFLYVKYSN